MTTRSITINQNTMMRNQELARFIECANSFKSCLMINTDDIRTNAKSLMGVLAMQMCIGMNVEITADGPDETEALNALVSRLCIEN